MSFTSFEYLAFLVIVAVAFKVMWRPWLKRGWLLLASYVFYGWWDPRFLLLVAGTTVFNWGAARLIARSADARTRKRILTAAVVADVLVLGVFKYYGFFVESLNSVLRTVGTQLSVMNIIVPLAISFMTFQVIAYVVDVYREDIEPASLTDVALLVAFFPHLVAGPILRPGDFISQLQGDLRASATDVNAGVQRFLFGAVLKLLIADRLALFVNPVMNGWGKWSSATLLLGILAYSLQIYTDFAGYTFMAIGSAQLMGLRLPENFDAPYTSLSITEFWRRWHMTLSHWLRTYVYIPLGGNRKGNLRQDANLMITFLVAGIWHGAAWHFVLWGGLQGAALVIHKGWLRWKPDLSDAQGRWFRVALAWLLTFGFVSIAWVYFRMPSVSAANAYLIAATGLGRGITIDWFAPSVFLCSVAVVVFEAIIRRNHGWPVLDLTTFGGTFAVTTALIAIVVLMPTQPAPFIYAQF